MLCVVPNIGWPWHILRRVIPDIRWPWHVLRRAIPGIRWSSVGVFDVGGEKDEASELGE